MWSIVGAMRCTYACSVASDHRVGIQSHRSYVLIRKVVCAGAHVPRKMGFSVKYLISETFMLGNRRRVVTMSCSWLDPRSVLAPPPIALALRRGKPTPQTFLNRNHLHCCISHNQHASIIQSTHHLHHGFRRIRASLPGEPSPGHPW
jgi:hypothetical protein